MFVANFIGSPSMNFLHLQGSVSVGDTTISLAGQSFDIPEMLQGCEGDIAFGVRPEHIFFDQKKASIAVM